MTQEAAMRAIRLQAFGNPIEGLQLAELPEPPPPGAGEVLIGIDYAPVNLNDLSVARGQFATLPTLPSVIGNEGVGRILALGAGVQGLDVGDRVLPPLGSYTWRERLVLPAAGLSALPDGDLQQQAMLSINPPTAAILLDRYADLAPGSWVVQNAASSGVGRWVIALARERGLRTINVVRRAELVAELEAQGADAVLVDGPELAKRIRAAAGGAPLRLALDGVGGASAAALAGALSPHGTLAVYAALAGAPLTLSQLDIIYKPVTVKGFFLGHPEHQAHVPAALAEAAALVAAGAVRVPVAATYPLSAIRDAVAHVLRGGKVLLEIAAR
jgi:NADPH:quinone reductase-like Zn-dependent oxidoreductase